MRALEFQWMNLVGNHFGFIQGPSCNCSQMVHPGMTCLQELFLKFRHTLNTISKFYVIFHLVPFLLKVKKLIREQRVFKGSMRAMVNFLGSLCFMLHLVCGLKATLCIHSNLGLPIDGISFLIQGKLSFGVDFLPELVFFGNPLREDKKSHITLLFDH